MPIWPSSRLVDKKKRTFSATIPARKTRAMLTFHLLSYTQLKYHIRLQPHLIGHTAKAQSKAKRTQNILYMRWL